MSKDIVRNMEDIEHSMKYYHTTNNMYLVKGEFRKIHVYGTHIGDGKKGRRSKNGYEILPNSIMGVAYFTIYELYDTPKIRTNIFFKKEEVTMKQIYSEDTLIGTEGVTEQSFHHILKEGKPAGDYKDGEFEWYDIIKKDIKPKGYKLILKSRSRFHFFFNSLYDRILGIPKKKIFHDSLDAVFNPLEKQVIEHFKDNKGIEPFTEIR